MDKFKPETSLENPSTAVLELNERDAEEIMKRRIEEGLEKGELPRYASFGVLIDETGELLLVERNTPPQKGKFSVVGGKNDFDAKKYEEKVLSGASPISNSMLERGIKTPTATICREVVEEIFADNPTLAEKVRIMNEDGNSFPLEQMFEPRRMAIVYDSVHNTYCALYVLKMPNINTSPSSREVGVIKKLSQIPEADRATNINPLTRWFLYKFNFLNDTPSDIKTGELKRIYFLDGPVGQSDKSQLQGLDLKEPGGIIVYDEKNEKSATVHGWRLWRFSFQMRKAQIAISNAPAMSAPITLYSPNIMFIFFTGFRLSKLNS